ncbi:DUF3383 family protein [Brevibacillus borstelensis]|uniref:DUF3383 family protein n=1 Tax=Brevibacillus borstelensis TaxID=45462 RepID=UPI00287F8ADA|nr:DUF3383 family protein [Brevibacillus borstelensis]WNF07267.1 DUF3383 family protein [Brevibacillus borstelensis]
MAQSLDDIVKVNVIVSPMAQSAGTFDIGLIVGKSTVISASDRVKIYSSLADMKAGGWTGTEPEYAAAMLYFSQNPTPSKLVVGRWDASADPAETPEKAVEACRAANNDWYGCYVADATATEIQAVAAAVEAMSPESVYFYDTDDADVASGTAGNIMETLKGLGYSRTFGLFSSTAYAGAAVMGYAMGANTGGANSAYTLAYKALPGVAPDPLTTTQVNYILGVNGNVYTTYGVNYKLLVQGTMASGVHFDEVLNLDMLKAEIQIGAVNALVAAKKIPQTEDGLSLLISAIEEQCEKSVTRGAIAPGVWKAAPILSLQPGDVLSKGYLVLAGRIADQTQDEREARKAPPIYVPVKMAGAIEHVVINVTVNR